MSSLHFLRKLSAVALASLAGCGGCDACSGKPGTETAVAPAYTASEALAVHDSAAASPEPTDAAGAGRDAAADATPPVVPLAVSAPERPRGPMPMGAFQSCGVYDGPLCTKLCPKGNCRQECDGVDCVLSCVGGYCSQLCGASATCRLTCNGGHCVQVCTGPGCLKDCSGGGCQ